MPPKAKDTSDPSLPTPSHLTLLFKSSRTTILLYALRDTPFSTLKSSLLSALRSRPTSIPIPGDATEEDIYLAKRGEGQGEWVSLEDEGSKVGEACAASCGVRDLDVIAFRIGEGEGWSVEEARFEDEEE